MLISPSLNIRLWHASYGILEQLLRQPTHEKFICEVFFNGWVGVLARLCDVFLLVGILARHLDGSNIYFVGHRRRR